MLCASNKILEAFRTSGLGSECHKMIRKRLLRATLALCAIICAVLTTGV